MQSLCSSPCLKPRSRSSPLPRPATTASLLRCSPPRPNLGLLCGPSLRLKAHPDGESHSAEAQEDDDELYRGESTMPERFRYLAKEAPDPPLRWPWFVALVFLAYAWRAVLDELCRWARPPLAVVSFVGNLVGDLLGCIGSLPRIFIGTVFGVFFGFVGDHLSIIGGFVPPSLLSPVWALYTSSIGKHAPVPEFITIIIGACLVLAVGEAAAPTSTSCQPYLLALSGFIALAAVRSCITQLLTWMLLLGVYAFSRLVKKRDEVASALPAAAVLAAVGGPWVRLLAVGSYTSLAIFYHSKNAVDQSKEVEADATSRGVSLPLLGAALAIGIRLATQWHGNRHLTWMMILRR